MAIEILPTTEGLVTANTAKGMRYSVSTAMEKYQRKKGANNNRGHITHIPGECTKFKISYSPMGFVVMS